MVLNQKMYFSIFFAFSQLKSVSRCKKVSVSEICEKHPDISQTDPSGYQGLKGLYFLSMK